MRVMFAIAVLLVAPRAAAQDIDLGEGVSVHRDIQPCSYDAFQLCSWWSAEGLTFGDWLELPAAATFARSPSGRIVAMIPWQARPWATPTRAIVLYTDDRGASWRLGDWPDGMLHAVSIAFDPGGALAVAVGPDGSVWSSTDDGATWRRRRSSTGAGFRRVWVRGRTALIEDANGALWISRDGGFALSSFADRGATVDASDDGIVIVDRGRSRRIDARGATRR